MVTVPIFREHGTFAYPHEDKAPADVQHGFDVIKESITRAANELKAR